MNPAQETLPLQVSVIITSFHSVVPLRRCVAALDASEARDRMEILVVDNGSRDGSSSIDSEFPNVTVMRLPRYFGSTKARNIGTRTAKGEYVLFLTPQIVVKPDTVRRLAETIEARPELGAVCPLILDEAGQPARQLAPFPSPDNLSVAANGHAVEMAVEAGEGLIEVGNPTFKAFLTRRQTIAAMNYLDERFGEYWSDTDLCFKLRKAGKKLGVERGIVATEMPDGLWRPSSSVAKAFAADRAVGASQFAGKHFGGIMGATLRAGTLFKALGSGQFSAFTRILSGQKIDGSEVITP